MHIDYGIEDKIGYCLDIILKEARKEEKLSYQLLITMLSTYSNNPINLLINAPSGVGKNYVINIVSSLFPQSDILSLVGMTDKALFHRSGILVIKNENGEYESIEDKVLDIDKEIEEKKHELNRTYDKIEKQALRSLITTLNQDKKNLLKDARKLIDLSNKIIIFLDTPRQELLSGLLPLLSHDKFEVEYEFTDTHNGIKTKNNVLRGWPAVIIAQALDYSHSLRFPEYQRRFITTNPTMTKEKYNEAINLIFDKSSVPDLVYQNKVLSDEEKAKAREIIKGLKEKIQDIYHNGKPGKNNVIIPFSDLIIGSIPKEKASDMIRANRLSTYLSFLPIVYFYKRPRITLVKKGDITIHTIPIATFEDLQNTLSLMEYSDGVRPYILEWYYDIFLKAFEEKREPDSRVNSKGEELKEDRIALTSQDIIKKHFEINNETLTSKRLLESYIYPLFNQGYIDKIESVIDKRANIYFPIIITKKYINLFENEQSNNLSQQKQKILVKSSLFPSKEYIISKIEPIIKYYSENGYYIKIKNNLDEEISLEELVYKYFSNANDYFKELDNNIEYSNSITEEQKQKEKEKNNYSKELSTEEYFPKNQNMEKSKQNQEKDTKILTNSEKEPQKLFDNDKKNKIIYSPSNADFFFCRLSGQRAT
jgi:hypothetical protein